MPIARKVNKIGNVEAIVSGDINVKESAAIKNKLIVYNKTTMYSTLDVSGLVRLASTLDTSGSVLLRSTPNNFPLELSPDLSVTLITIV